MVSYCSAEGTQHQHVTTQTTLSWLRTCCMYLWIQKVAECSASLLMTLAGACAGSRPSSSSLLTLSVSCVLSVCFVSNITEDSGKDGCCGMAAASVGLALIWHWPDSNMYMASPISSSSNSNEPAEHSQLSQCHDLSGQAAQ